MKQYYYLITAKDNGNDVYWSGKKWGDEDKAKRYLSSLTALKAIDKTVSSMDFSRLKDPIVRERYTTLNQLPASIELRTEPKTENLYDFITSWLKEKGCEFVDHGGWGVTESSDIIFVFDKHRDAEPAIVVSLAAPDGSVGITTRLWHDDNYNIESRANNITRVRNKQEAIAVLVVLHECLCQVNELVARLREDMDSIEDEE
jgi:hypothetical protein